MQSSGRWSNWQDRFAQGVKGNYFGGRAKNETVRMPVYEKVNGNPFATIYSPSFNRWHLNSYDGTFIETPVYAIV